MLRKQIMVTPDTALPGRSDSMLIEKKHYVNKNDITAEPAQNQQKILFGMGCFWGAERLFWQLEGVISTAVGYSGGYTPNPTYDEVCTGRTGHTEVVRIIYDPQIITLPELLNVFWEHHNPTQGMQQGNDIGSQYRSAIYFYNEQQQHSIEKSQKIYQKALNEKSIARITTEIGPAGPYYYAETYHQQYLAKNPAGYCGLNGTGVCFPPEK
ncbi:peptide-methionine (S)-S-oxide reductase MsrA [Vibrio salinus]|uniref:peptide-methionine (S)-S-oxide reductase MsrA n=1 Tax=Vibrio salinus TaxID=2899784 RepID=UPI001E452D27|nr:peptide-methionine (S)-S-oxide reductase MsrA [Vibrio salinus]MCE0494037.1 peptide-methionine (S)-S-oxide reductase MsrA [Vibrio salinus]